MATSPETFNQVRDILRKLDRSIDNARNRRLAGREGDAPDQPTPEGEDAATAEPYDLLRHERR
jgi:hypothetical protein